VLPLPRLLMHLNLIRISATAAAAAAGVARFSAATGRTTLRLLLSNVPLCRPPSRSETERVTSSLGCRRDICNHCTLSSKLLPRPE
jgi:hypothetical protein